MIITVPVASERTMTMKKLIELDSAIKETWKDTGYTDPLNVMTAIRDRLEGLPTVDAVPVVHGHWKEDPSGYGFWICSKCGFVSEASAANMLYKFCPVCGADMRKDGDGNG